MASDVSVDLRQARWDLRVVDGRAVLSGPEEAGEVDPARLRLSVSLVEALHEWAKVVDAVEQGEDVVGESAANAVSRRGRQLAIRLAVETGGEVGYLDPSTGELHRLGRRWRTPAPEDPEPTPWGTGLTVSAIIAAIVVIALVVVTLGLAEVNVLLAVVVNLAVAAGFAPSIWLGRRVPVWRWVALGTAAGVVLAWVTLLLSTLG